MKKLFAIIFGALLAFVHAHAQSIPGPLDKALFTNLTVIYIPGITTTSFPVTMANLLPVGKNGAGFYFGMGATNAASTTNATMLVELVNIDTISGLTNVVDNQTYTLSIPQNGLTRYDYFTNLVPTTANYGNGNYLRVRSLQNTNELGIFITNATQYVRE